MICLQQQLLLPVKKTQPVTFTFHLFARIGIIQWQRLASYYELMAKDRLSLYCFQSSLSVSQRLYFVPNLVGYQLN